MELMGYDYLSFDQDKVAMTLAKEYQMDWSKISASSLPAVAGEAPLPGLLFIEFVMRVIS